MPVLEKKFDKMISQLSNIEVLKRLREQMFALHNNNTTWIKK